MPRGHPDLAMKAACIKLRIQERLTLKEIHRRMGVPAATLSLWLRPYPLSAEEMHKVLVLSGQKGRGRRRAPRLVGGTSKCYRMAAGRHFTRLQLGRIAEVAVLLRLLLNGFDVLKSPFEGDRTDWWVLASGRARPIRLQVKSVSHHVKRGRATSPSVRLRAPDGKRYAPGDFDCLVGYDLVKDRAYVWVESEVCHLRNAVAVSLVHAERWDKLRT